MTRSASSRPSASTRPPIDISPALLVGGLCLGLGVLAAAQARRGHDHDAIVFSLYAVPLLLVAAYLLVVRVQVRAEAAASIAIVVSTVVFVLATMATQHVMPTWAWWLIALVVSQGIGWATLWATSRSPGAPGATREHVVAARCEPPAGRSVASGSSSRPGQRADHRGPT